jgi:Fe-S-cluster containining protein
MRDKLHSLHDPPQAIHGASPPSPTGLAFLEPDFRTCCSREAIGESFALASPSPKLEWDLPVVRRVHKGELAGLGYRCLEDCGFCCTFTPEANPPELAKLRARFPQLPVTKSGSMTLLAAQGGCGACTLLKGKRCTAYDDRPAHCRYFPFHVYFGRRTEVYVNRSCRGVEPAPARNLETEFEAQVLANTKSFRLEKEQERADSVHKAFRAAAKQAGMWGDVDAEVARQLQRGPAWFQPGTWPATPTGAPDEAGSPQEAWQLALAPLGSEDAMVRPYHLGEDLRWLGFRLQDGGIVAETLTEDGRLEHFSSLGPMEGWPDLPAPVQVGLVGVMQRLAGRDLLAGSVYHLVDETGYEVSVADAAVIRLGDIAADLALRAGVLHRLGIPWEKVTAEAERFYDTAFLDLPTIGGWL